MNYIRRRIRGLATHIQRVTDVAFDKKSAGRDVEVLPGDVFIVSYPKSGNTWTRFLLGNLIYQDEPITFANVEDRLPSLYLYSNRKLRKLPRILKSHDCFDPRYKTVIYIVRERLSIASAMGLRMTLPKHTKTKDCAPLSIE